MKNQIDTTLYHRPHPFLLPKYYEPATPLSDKAFKWEFLNNLTKKRGREVTVNNNTVISVAIISATIGAVVINGQIQKRKERVELNNITNELHRLNAEMEARNSGGIK